MLVHGKCTHLTLNYIEDINDPHEHDKYGTATAVSIRCTRTGSC